MSNVTHEALAADAQPRETEAKPKKPAKGAKRAKNAKRGKKAKPGKKPAAERTNKKADVIAMMKRAKGATLAEIMKATGWQPHTVQIDSSKNAAGERTYKIAK